MQWYMAGHGHTAVRIKRAANDIARARMVDTSYSKCSAPKVKIGM